MKVLLDINDTYVPSINAARLAYNATLPPAASGIAAPGREPANPARFTSNEAFVQFEVSEMVKGWLSKYGVIPPATVIDGVPQEVSRAQAYEELVFQSLHNIDDPALSEIEKVIALIPDLVLNMRMKNMFRNSGTFERQNPELILLWTQALGKSLADLDATFISAAKR